MNDKTRVYTTHEFARKYAAEVTVEFREGVHIHVKRLTRQQATTLRDQLSAHLEETSDD